MSNDYQYNDDSNENVELFILNEKNIFITEKYVENMLKNYDVDLKVTKLENFQKAMIHKSYLVRDDEYYKNNKTKSTNKDLEPIKNPEKAIPLQKESYERLEFLGDSVIHLILAEYFFCRYEGEDEGFMTRLRTKIENSETLFELAKIIGLNKYVLISRYIEKNDGRDNNKALLEDSFEAFMAALYFEGGFEPCKKFLVTLIEEHIDFAQILYEETNHKDSLLQLFHKRGWHDPEYGALDISGPEHKKQFTMYVKCRKTPRDDGEIVGTACGSSKKKGEQEAARQALIYFGVIREEDSESEGTEELIDFE